LLATLRRIHGSALAAYYGRPVRSLHWLVVLDWHGRELWREEQQAVNGMRCPFVGRPKN